MKNEQNIQFRKQVLYLDIAVLMAWLIPKNYRCCRETKLIFSNSLVI